jgi:hypothetical protein
MKPLWKTRYDPDLFLIQRGEGFEIEPNSLQIQALYVIGAVVVYRLAPLNQKNSF